MSFFPKPHQFVLAMIVAAGLATVTSAQSGALDNSWNGNGKVQTSVSSLSGFVNDLYVYPNGKVLATGISQVTDDNTRTTLVRYNPNGTLDTTFGSGGIAQIDSNLYNQQGEGAYAVSVDPASGRIYIAADHFTSALPNPLSQNLVIYSLNDNGSLNTAFGTGGYRDFTVSDNSSETAADIALAPDGSVFVLGNSTIGGNDAAFILKLDASGALDTDFNSGGYVLLQNPALGRNFGAGLALQSNGSVIVVGGGYAPSAATQNAFVARYTAAGTPDTGFDADGWNIIGSNILPDAQFASVVTDSTGNIFAAGDANTFASAVLAKFNANGSPASGFGTSGFAVFNGTDSQSGLKLVLTSNSKLVMTLGKDDGDFHILAVAANGTRETTFGSNGEAAVSFNNASGYDLANAVALDPTSGKIYVGGEADGETDGVARFAIARFSGTSPTAASVSLSGRVMRGKFGLGGVTITLVNGSTGAIKTAVTNARGEYSFSNVAANNLYVVTAASKRYKFTPSSMSMNLSSNFEDANFSAQ